MMFMVREMYRHPSLAKWKVVFVTDRTQLEDQLSETSQSIGFSVKVADSIKALKELLASDSSDLVMAMIHKFRDVGFERDLPGTECQPVYPRDDGRSAPLAILDAGGQPRQGHPQFRPHRLHRHPHR